MDGERLHPRKMHEINPIIKEVNKEEENKESRDKIINVKNTFFTKFLWNTTATNEIQNPQTINISTRNPQTINISTRNPQIINQDETPENQDETPENQDETPENQDETPENQDNNESLYDMFIPSFRIKDEFDNDADDIYDNDINNNNNQNNNKNQEIEYNDTYNEIVIRIPKQRLNYIKSNTYERWSKQQSKERDNDQTKKRDKKDDKVKKWKSNQINKQRIFLETEYLEKYYEDITLIISPNKTITLDAFSKRKIIKKQDKQDKKNKQDKKDPRTNQSNEYKTHDKQYYKKMPMNIDRIKGEIKDQNKNHIISQKNNCQILEKREQEKREEYGYEKRDDGLGDGYEKRDDGLGDGDKKDGLGDGDNENPEKITFVLQSDYPETPPHLYVNDIPYVNVINCCKLSRIKEAVKKYTSVYRPYANCISCGSILTQVNWSTKIRFSNILAENIKIKKMKRIIKYDIAITEIAEIYELDYGIFVQIMSYLTV